MSPRAETTQGGPEHFVFGVAHIEIQDLTVSIGGDTGGDDHGPGDDPVVFVAVDIGGVDERVRELDVIQAPVTERGDFLVELFTDPAYGRLRDLRVDSESPHQVIHLPR